MTERASSSEEVDNHEKWKEQPSKRTSWFEIVRLDARRWEISRSSMSSMREPFKTTRYALVIKGAIMAEGFSFLKKGIVRITT